MQSPGMIFLALLVLVVDAFSSLLPRLRRATSCTGETVRQTDDVVAQPPGSRPDTLQLANNAPAKEISKAKSFQQVSGFLGVFALCRRIGLTL